MWSCPYADWLGKQLRNVALGSRTALCTPLATNSEKREELPPLNADKSDLKSSRELSSTERRISFLEAARAYPEVWISYGVTALLLTGTLVYFRRRLSAAERLFQSKQLEAVQRLEQEAGPVDKRVNESALSSAGLGTGIGSVANKPIEQKIATNCSDRSEVVPLRRRRGRPRKIKDSKQSGNSPGSTEVDAATMPEVDKKMSSK
jgi:hypothetical protein